MVELLSKINSLIWGIPTLLIIFLTGIILSIRTKFFQIRFFKQSFKCFFKNTTTKNGKTLTPLQSASTALSATIGTGNIVGVAGAVALGGPGVVFWMWISAAFCMIIKCSEIMLSVRFRSKNADGSYSGGTMHYIKNAFPKFLYPLGICFCIFGVFACFGVGNMTQINTLSSSAGILIKSFIKVSPKVEFLIKICLGIVCAILCALILKNDVSIGRFCEKIMPLMTLLYVGMTVFAIAINYKNIPFAFKQIFIGAFNPKGVTGGIIGSMFTCMRFGIARGVFSNEAGLGTAPIAYSCSDGDEIQLGAMGIIEVFIDTIVICTLTALTLLCAGEFSYGVDKASFLTFDALNRVYGKNIVFLFCPVVCFFAFSSIIGWGLYGTKFICFLFGENAKKFFLLFFIAAMIPAAVFRADAVWILAEIFNGLMCIPNIITLLISTNKIVDIINSSKLKKRCPC